MTITLRGPFLVPSHLLFKKLSENKTMFRHGRLIGSLLRSRRSPPPAGATLSPVKLPGDLTAMVSPAKVAGVTVFPANFAGDTRSRCGFSSSCLFRINDIMKKFEERKNEFERKKKEVERKKMKDEKDEDSPSNETLYLSFRAILPQHLKGGYGFPPMMHMIFQNAMKLAVGKDKSFKLAHWIYQDMVMFQVIDRWAVLIYLTTCCIVPLPTDDKLSMDEKLSERSDYLKSVLRRLIMTDYWLEGCMKVLRFGMKNNMLDVDLMRSLHKDFSKNDQFNTLFDDLFREISCSLFGKKVLEFIIEDLGTVASRMSLDLLLKISMKTRDKGTTMWTFEEYMLPFNDLTFLRFFYAFAVTDESLARQVLSMLIKQGIASKPAYRGFNEEWLMENLNSEIAHKYWKALCN